MKYVFGMKIRTYEFPCTTTGLPVAGVFPPRSSSPPRHSEVTTILSSLFLLPFLFFMVLPHIFVSVHNISFRLACFELRVNGIVEGGYASAPCFFHSPLSWDSTMSSVVLQRFTALYEYNTFYFSSVDGLFSLFHMLLLLHTVLPSVSPGMFVRGIL